MPRPCRKICISSHRVIEKVEMWAAAQALEKCGYLQRSSTTGSLHAASALFLGRPVDDHDGTTIPLGDPKLLIHVEDVGVTVRCLGHLIVHGAIIVHGVRLFESHHHAHSPVGQPAEQCWLLGPHRCPKRLLPLWQQGRVHVRSRHQAPAREPDLQALWLLGVRLAHAVVLHLPLEPRIARIYASEVNPEFVLALAAFAVSCRPNWIQGLLYLPLHVGRLVQVKGEPAERVDLIPDLPGESRLADLPPVGIEEGTSGRRIFGGVQRRQGVDPGNDLGVPAVSASLLQQRQELRLRLLRDALRPRSRGPPAPPRPAAGGPARLRRGSG
mmetsp:Transcript_90785/g.265756  ORF Transcript_90785/g.265756 Transcript_90785/m.265756 type:complete len:327 (-) Transcript_90785:260-1240(-)